MTQTARQHAETIAEAISNYSIATSNESELQLHLCEILNRSHIAFLREYPLSSRDRIDFYIPSSRVGLEVKVAGSRPAVMRQAMRYCESDEIEALVIVTTRAAHDAIPEELRHTPVVVVGLWRTSI